MKMSNIAIKTAALKNGVSAALLRKSAVIALRKIKHCLLQSVLIIINDTYFKNSSKVYAVI